MIPSARALAGNRWHIQTGHFEAILLKGYFLNGGRVQEEEPVRVQFSGMVRTGRH